MKNKRNFFYLILLIFLFCTNSKTIFSMYDQYPPTPPNTPNENYTQDVAMEKVFKDIKKAVKILKTKNILEKINKQKEIFSPILIEKTYTILEAILKIENEEEQNKRISLLENHLQDNETDFEFYLDALEYFLLNLQAKSHY